MLFRTDLALEKHENLSCGELEGIISSKKESGSVITTRIEVINEKGAAMLGKPVGVYYTVETGGFPDAQNLCDERLFEVKNILTTLISGNEDILVAGLGNNKITPDALGTECASMIFSTRHISEKALNELGLPKKRNVCAVCPGVTGQTGIEASEIIAGICEKVKPSKIIVIDALAAGSVKRLANTVQISSVGIEPGSGVGNGRKAITKETLGVPVISVGVPTVVDALSLAKDVTGADEIKKHEEQYEKFVVTPRNIDTLISSAARFLALAINSVLHPDISEKELLSLM